MSRISGSSKISRKWTFLRVPPFQKTPKFLRARQVLCDLRFESQIAIVVKSDDLKHLASGRKLPKGLCKLAFASFYTIVWPQNDGHISWPSRWHWLSRVKCCIAGQLQWHIKRQLVQNCPVPECTKPSHSQSLAHVVANVHVQGISTARTKISPVAVASELICSAQFATSFSLRFGGENSGRVRIRLFAFATVFWGCSNDSWP